MPHPVHAQWSPVWQQLLDVYEGAGGFLDPTRPYLAPHPREWEDHSTKIVSEENPTGKWIPNPNPSRPSPKLKSRRRIARYEGIAATLIDQLRATLFRTQPSRGFEQDGVPDTHPLRQFWDDPDGSARGIDAVIQEYWTGAAVFGHVAVMADRAGDTPETVTRADVPPVLVRCYTPLDVVDWLTDDQGFLTAVRLLEAQPRTSFDEAPNAVALQVRDVDATQWQVREILKTNGRRQVLAEAGDSGVHGFGVLPVIYLFAKRRPLLPSIGKSVLGDPQLYIDHYNLISEVRELLRNQTFALLNIPLGKDGSIERESLLLGETSGTSNVTFSSEPIAYVSPEGTNVEMYHEHIDRLTRTIYRLAVVSWEADSRDAESEGSRKLKASDLHAMLAGYASECEATETQLAQLVYRAHYGAQWEAQWERERPRVSYPDEFDVTGLLESLEQATAALALELGETATRQIKKQLVPKLLPNLPQSTAKQIEDEINAMPVQTAQDKQREMLELQTEADVALQQQAAKAKVAA